MCPILAAPPLLTTTTTTTTTCQKMKGIVASALVALSATAAAASIDNGQIAMGDLGIRHSRESWPSNSKDHVALPTSASAPAPASRVGGPSYFDTDPAATANMGIGGPLRIELPINADHGISALAGTSVEQMIAAQRGEHVVLTHQDFPQMSVRIKQIHAGTGKQRQGQGEGQGEGEAHAYLADPDAFCDPTVTSWSGYIDTIDGKSIFFYFFESRSNPKDDPVIFWTNGGPGCSSSLGLFSELGPCRVPEGSSKNAHGPPINGTVFHPQSWTNRANVFFVDQPVGVGFSYSRYGVNSYNTEDAAKDIYRFLRIFFSAFDRFRDNDFHMAGESYGGRYIPVFASEVSDRNAEIRAKAKKQGKKPAKDELINLKSVLIGNGLTDISKQVGGYYDMTCTRKGGVEPVLSIETCKRMATWVPRCEKWLHEKCTATYTADLCAAALDTCSAELEAPYFETGLNPYNIKDDCKAGLDPNLCYNVVQDIRAYLDRDDVRKLLGAAPVSEIGKFQSCNNDVAQGFGLSNDRVQDNTLNVAGLVERGIAALIYVGDLDWICNWRGNKNWVSQLDWSGSDEWHAAKNYKWIVDGQEAGETQSGGGLTWATVKDAGHMVPYDQPDRALAMLNRWLDGEQL